MTWRPVDSQADLLPDSARFLETINAHSGFFDASAPLVVARAPGRLDVMGGIADYSGSLVLELPLSVAAFVAAQPAPEQTIAIRSLQAATIEAEPEVTIALADLAPGGAALDYTDARMLLAADPRAHWAAYIAGALIVLGRERGLTIDRGLRLLLDSQVMPGKGISSSAAIEVAAMQAICALYDVELPGRELAILCQKIENLVVGAPCGVMDQMTAACGEQDALLALRCQPAELEPPVALPAELEVWGIDSGIRHAVTGADYGSVRVGAFMGYRIIADLAGLSIREDTRRHTKNEDEPTCSRIFAPLRGSVQIEDPRWHGYLANIPPSMWEQHYRDRVPEQMDGAAFLARYGGTTDTVTQVDPSRTFAVRQPTAHPIYEHHHVRLFRALLESLTNDQPFDTAQGRRPTTNDQRQEEMFKLLGELMYQSHASYSACGLGSDGTDRLVELVRDTGPAGGLYGAKITGGGSGGTVAILARRNPSGSASGAADAVRAVAARYQQETGRTATLLSGSSPGAKAFGVVWLQAD